MEFGEKIPGKEYIERPGVYGVVKDTEGKIGVVESRGQCHLIGGGIDSGESPEETMKREALEEIGWEIEVISKVGEANVYANTHHGKEAALLKICTFFEIRLVNRIEGGHSEDSLIWLTPEEVPSRMEHDSSVWAIQQTL